MSFRSGVFEGADESAGVRSAAVAEYEVHQARRQRLFRVGQVLVGVVLIAFWEFASGNLMDPFFISAPTAVAAKLYQWLMNGELVLHLSITLYATVWGFTIGAVTGFTAGFVFGRSEAIATIFDPYITAIYCIPKIALAPLFIMWFGIGIESKIAMSGTIVFFLVFLNTFAGVRDVNPVFIHATRIMGANEWQLLRTVIGPSAAAWVLTGLKVSVPYALIGTVVGEFMSSNRGIGFLIAQASGLFDTASVFAGLVILAFVGGILNAVLKRIERRALRWRGT